MQMAISAQKPPARNALIVGVSCVNPTWKPVADATRFSVRVAFSSKPAHRERRERKSA